MNGPITGPCCVCGDTNYQPSLGGPTICPACDCGASTDPRVARNLRVEIDRLRAENDDLKRVIGNRRDHIFVDATPDAELPRRILSAYIDDSKIISTDDTLSQMMNGWQDERNAILRAALAKL